MKKHFNICTYSYFVLTWFVVTGMFNGLSSIILTASQKIFIDTLLIIGLFIFNKRLSKFSLKQILFISFYLFLSFFSLIFYVNNNHYGFEKLLKNVVLTVFVSFNYFVLYKTFYKNTFTTYLYILLGFQIFITLFLAIFFFLYNKNTGYLGHSIVQIVVFQDWEGRFQGTFSEPSFLGVWLGSTIFLLPLLWKSCFSYFISGIFIFILYSFCKAKFALLAFPIALGGAVVIKRCVLKSVFKQIWLYFSLICLFSLFFTQFVNIFFSFVCQFFGLDGSATYVTRFGLLFASLQNICFYPLGTGFGFQYETLQNIFTEIIPIADKFNLDTNELLGYRLNPNSMGSKETVSFVTSTAGFLGIFLFISYFKKLLNSRYNHTIASTGLILFLFIEFFITSNAIAHPAFFILLFSKIALNTDKRKF